MKNKFSYFAICWAVLLALFNIIAFVSENLLSTEKYTSLFWIGYIFITFAFLGNLVCGYVALKEDNNKKLFLNIPLVKASYTGLILMAIFGSICMAVPFIPDWVGIIICVIILAATILAVVKAKAAGEMVSEIGEKVKAQTQFIKMARVDAESLVRRATDEDAKAICNKVYEALRFSDPMSDNALVGVESKISTKMEELSFFVRDNNSTKIKETADEILLLIEERNSKCKALK